MIVIDVLSGPTQLKWHSLYVLIIAVNGITECFMFATMSQAAVEKYNQKMVIFSILFLISSWFLTYFGAVGFIFANCLNMILRIIHRCLLFFLCTYYFTLITLPRTRRKWFDPIQEEKLINIFSNVVHSLRVLWFPRTPMSRWLEWVRNAFPITCPFLDKLEGGP